MRYKAGRVENVQVEAIWEEGLREEAGRRP